MNSSRLVRGAKMRLIACGCCILVLITLVYIFHGYQTDLASVQRKLNECTQRSDSQSAQLQVLVEYKERLEKSLQTSRDDLKKKNEDCEKRVQVEKELTEKERISSEHLVAEKNDLKRQLDELKDKYDRQVETVSKDNSDLKLKIEPMSNIIKNLENDRDLFKEKVSDLEEKLKKYEEENKLLQKQMEQKNHMELSGSTKTSGNSNKMEMKKSDQEKHALEPPVEKSVDMLLKGNSSTTPGINPQAIYNPQDSSSTKAQDRAEPIAVPVDVANAAPLLGLGQIPVPPDHNAPAVAPKPNIQHNENTMERQQSIDWDEKKDPETNNAAIEDVGNDFIHGL